MKITSYNSEVSAVIYEAFCDFKNYCHDKNITTFTYNALINFINSNEDYFLIAFKWHQNKKILREKSGGLDPVSVFEVLMAFSGEYAGKNFKDEKDQIKILVKKLGPDKFEFI